MNIQERRDKNGNITSYRIRVFNHRDVTTGKQVSKTLSVKYDIVKSKNWNRKNAEKEGAIFEKSVHELTVATANITFDSYAEYCLVIKKQTGLATSAVYHYGISRKI